MKLQTLENGKLYYIRSRYGSEKMSSKKSFVRIGKFENDKLVGSEMYCCDKSLSLVFKNMGECDRFRKLYSCDDEICELKLKDEYKDLVIELKEYEYKGIRCFKIKNNWVDIVRKFKYNY